MQMSRWHLGGVAFLGLDPNAAVVSETGVQSCSQGQCNQLTPLVYLQSTGDFAVTNGVRLGLNYGGTATLGTWALTVTSAVPEPSSCAMMLLGFVGLGFMAHRRNTKRALLAA